MQRFGGGGGERERDVCKEAERVLCRGQGIMGTEMCAEAEKAMCRDWGTMETGLCTRRPGRGEVDRRALCVVRL